MEIQREPEYMRDNIFASLHCVPYLYDASKVIAITQFTGLEAMTERAKKEGFKATAADGGMQVTIPECWQAPTGYSWVYVINNSAAELGEYGAAYTQGTAWENAEKVLGGTGAYCHLLLIDSDKKPVKTLTLTAE